MTLGPFDTEHTPIRGTMLLEASAGTGKTYALERMVTRLVGGGEGIDRILVVTFTNRAAREMKERIRGLLTRRAADSRRGEVERERYRAALAGFDSAAIFTIHSFCRMVLATWPFESSAPFRQELLPGSGLELREARAWLAGLETSEVDGELLRAAYHRAGTAENLIRGLAASLGDEGVPPGARVRPSPEESAAFSNLVTESKRADSAFAGAARNVFVRDWDDAAFKSVFQAAGGPNKTAPSLAKIREHMRACRNLHGLPDLAAGMFGDPSKCGVKNHFKELLFAAQIAGDRTAGELGGALNSLLTVFGPYVEYRPDGKVKTVESLVERHRRCLFEDIARRVVEKRVEIIRDETGVWGYSDLIRRVVDAVTADDSPLLPLLRQRFRAALIDEFQDTDPRQWRLFHKVFDTPNHILVLIGDPKQSIYGFRGTGLQAYAAALSAVPEGGRYRLDTNYRSRKPLVAAVNRIFAPVFQNSADGTEPVGFEPVQSGLTWDKRLEWPGGEVPVTLFNCDSEPAAADFIVSEIRSLLDPELGGRWMGSGAPENLRASDIAVLVRWVRQEEDIMMRLSAAGVPALRFRSRSVFAQPVAEALGTLLWALETPRDLSRWRTVLLDDFFRIPPDLLHKFERDGYMDVIVEAGTRWRDDFLAGRSAEVLESFLRFSSTVADWAKRAGRRDVARFLSTPWTERIVAAPKGERLWQDWRHLVELIQTKQAGGVRSLSGIRDWMRRSAEQGDSEDGTDAQRLETESPAVWVMTMHSAKGLEFPLVFVHGGYTGKTSRTSDGPYRFDDGGTLLVDRLCREEHFDRHRAYAWEEDKRLWYVTLTRAAYKVWLPRYTGEGGVMQIESLLDMATDPEPGGGLPPHESLTKAAAGPFREHLAGKLKVLAESTEAPVELRERNLVHRPPLVIPPLPEPLGAGLPDRPPGERDPVTSSYTSLVRRVGEELADSGDRDTDAVVPPIAGEWPESVVPLSEDRGAVFGTLIHGLLEECDFEMAGEDDEALWMEDEANDGLFASISGRYYTPDWYRSRGEELKKLVRTALRAPIPGIGRLCDTPPKRRRAEVEFQMAIPESGRIALDEAAIRFERGYLKGFIDLLVLAEGRWWVVDWKTNLPLGGESEGLWSSDSLNRLMKSHHYHFQYELYLLALCRTLSGSFGRPVNWESEIGGTAYLFLRGMREDVATGIYSAKPSLDRMREVAGAVGLEGVV